MSKDKEKSANAVKHYYEDYGITSNDKKDLDNQELYNLYKVPKKDKGLNETHYQEYKPMMIQQADILYLPSDDEYKYALVVVDIGSRYVDAVPLKNKTSADVVEGLKKIYSSNLLKKPKTLEVDPGPEFKGEVLTYLKDNKIDVSVGKVGRHKQQAIVERKNQMIGTAIHKRQTAQELLTGETDKHWVDDLRVIINAINRKAKNQKIKKLPDTPVCQGDSCNMLDKGTKVRVKLEEPRDVTTGKRLPGKFRSGDIRWDPTPREIKEPLLRPGEPPMYLLDGNKGSKKIEPIAYTKNELQVIPKNEEAPPADKVIRGKPTQYIINKIIDDKIIKGKRHYLIRWKGHTSKDDTWEPASNIAKDSPKAVQEYAETLKLILK